MQRSLVSHSQAGLFPCVSTHSQREAPRRSIVLSPTWRAFVDGFGGSLVGGLTFCVVLAYVHPDGLELAWLRVLAVSMIFGGFEMWRAARRRTLSSVRKCMLWTLTASLLALWALGAVISSTDSSSRETPPYFKTVAHRFA